MGHSTHPLISLISPLTLKTQIPFQISTLFRFPISLHIFSHTEKTLIAEFNRSLSLRQPRNPNPISVISPLNPNPLILILKISRRNRLVMDSRERRRNRPKMMRMASDDILMSIISRTPAKSVIRFRCVSKHWFSLTHDPYFLTMYLRNSPERRCSYPCIAVKDVYDYGDADNEDYDEAHNVHSCGLDGCNFNTFRLYSLEDNDACTLTRTITAKCFYRLLPTTINGLICLASDTDVIVLNPTTNESITITLPDCGSYQRPEITLGFDPISCKYKLILGVWQKWEKINFDEIECRLQVFTIGPSESWRSLGAISFPMDMSATFVRGIMYWLSTFSSPNGRDEIVAFDLSDEQLRSVEPPSCRWDSRQMHYDVLHEWDGKLCFLCYYGFSSIPDSLDVWVRTDCTRNDWVKMYSICLGAFSNQGPMNLIWMSEEKALFSSFMRQLFFYYFATKTWKFVDDFEMTTLTPLNAYVKTLTPVPLSSA